MGGDRQYMRRGQTVYKGVRTLQDGGHTYNICVFPPTSFSIILFGLLDYFSNDPCKVPNHGHAYDAHGQYEKYFDENVGNIYIYDDDMQICSIK